MSSKFTVVICHGSYHTPEPYEPLITALQANGIETYCPQRPTCDLQNLNIGDPQNPDFDRPPPEDGYPAASEDAAVVGKLLDELISANKSVLLVAHSSGGWVASEAAKSARHASVRNAAGQSGGLIGIFFAGAFIIPPGESVHSYFQPKDGSSISPPWVRHYQYGHEGLATFVEPVKYLFNDVEPVKAEKWAATLTAAPDPKCPLTHDPYSTLPCVFLILENDLTLPKEYQEGMVAAHNAVNERKIPIIRCPAGHSPHISWTAGLRDEIEKFGVQILAEV